MSAVTVGLTGGIGSGKSTVAGMLEAKGAALIDAGRDRPRSGRAQEERPTAR